MLDGRQYLISTIHCIQTVIPRGQGWNVRGNNVKYFGTKRKTFFSEEKNHSFKKFLMLESKTQNSLETSHPHLLPQSPKVIVPSKNSYFKKRIATKFNTKKETNEK